MNLDPLRMLFYIINLALLFVIYRFLLYKPVMKFINKRRDKINDELDSAAKAEQESKEKLEQYNGILAQADSEGHSAAEHIIGEAKKEARGLVDNAHMQADDLLKQAESEKEEQLRKAREQLKRESVTLAVDIAGTILQKEMTQSEQLDMINRYAEKLE